jgi:hypothetical protein
MSDLYTGKTGTYRSYTARSCAINWVSADEVVTSQIVAVVSMEQVTIDEGE